MKHHGLIATPAAAVMVSATPLAVAAVPARAATPVPPMPPCALRCLIQAAPWAGCALSNTTCLCTSPAVQKLADACISANCTIRQQLMAANSTTVTCNRARTDEVQTIHLALIPRYVAPTVLLMTESGLGRDIWTLSFEEINRCLFLFFISIPFFLVTLTAGKASILFMYSRIFIDKRFRRVVWASQIFNLCFFLAFLIPNLVACRPLSAFWLNWDGEHPGRCTVGPEGSNYVQAVIGLCLDVWMLLLPVAPVWKLNMRLKTKLAVLLMFASGILWVSLPSCACRLKTGV
ncbi:hypothetical protein RB594_002474 [Gaeumannomyces avenae]